MMFILYRFRILFVFCLLSCLPVFTSDHEGRDRLFELKSGAFIPTGSCFRAIYGSATYFINPEFTFQVKEDNNWYVFLSSAYAAKNGRSVGLCTPTKAKLVPFGIGLKYFFKNSQECYSRKYNFYLGLGFQPTLLKTNNCSDFVKKTSDWGCGGIAKFGCLWKLPCNFFLDFFADYSFVTIGCNTSCNSSSSCSSASSMCVSSYDVAMPLKANVSGAILGIGIGYNF